MNLLFICSKNRLRSPTAELVFSAYPGIEAIAAGLNADSTTPVSGDLIEWADLILVMERSHQQKLNQRYSALLKGKKVAVLGIGDRYAYMAPELIAILKRRVSKYLPRRVGQ
ncbi:MAG: low molecular weight protein tyrosine phosphatase family protein [Spirulinaceae cyanobacterium]